jgi:hypothetical protein
MSPQSPKLEALRAQIRALEGHALNLPDTKILDLGDVRLNAPLAHGGLPLGALHEITAEGLEAELGAGVAGFAACLAGRLVKRTGKPALWAATRPDAYAPGLATFGLSPSHLLWVCCRREADVLAVMEEALQTPALAAVLGEAGSIGLKSARRLEAAARRSGVTAFLLRRRNAAPRTAKASPSGAAFSRWRVASLPGETDEPGLGPPRWRLDLDYSRNGKTASFIVEASHAETGEAGHVRVVAELGHDAGAPETAAARRTA